MGMIRTTPWLEQAAVAADNSTSSRVSLEVEGGRSFIGDEQSRKGCTYGSNTVAKEHRCADRLDLLFEFGAQEYAGRCKGPFSFVLARAVSRMSNRRQTIRRFATVVTLRCHFKEEDLFI